MSAVKKLASRSSNSATQAHRSYIDTHLFYLRKKATQKTFSLPLSPFLSQSITI